MFLGQLFIVLLDIFANGEFEYCCPENSIISQSGSGRIFLGGIDGGFAKDSM